MGSWQQLTPYQEREWGLESPGVTCTTREPGFRHLALLSLLGSTGLLKGPMAGYESLQTGRCQEELDLENYVYRPSEECSWTHQESQRVKTCHIGYSGSARDADHQQGKSCDQGTREAKKTLLNIFCHPSHLQKPRHGENRKSLLREFSVGLEGQAKDQCFPGPLSPVLSFVGKENFKLMVRLMF